MGKGGNQFVQNVGLSPGGGAHVVRLDQLALCYFQGVVCRGWSLSVSLGKCKHIKEVIFVECFSFSRGRIHILHECRNLNTENKENGNKIHNTQNSNENSKKKKKQNINFVSGIAGSKNVWCVREAMVRGKYHKVKGKEKTRENRDRLRNVDQIKKGKKIIRKKEKKRLWEKKGKVISQKEKLKLIKTVKKKNQKVGILWGKGEKG